MQVLHVCLVDGETEVSVMRSPEEVRAEGGTRLCPLSCCAKWGLRGSWREAVRRAGNQTRPAQGPCCPTVTRSPWGHQQHSRSPGAVLLQGTPRCRRGSRALQSAEESRKAQDGGIWAWGHRPGKGGKSMGSMTGICFMSGMVRRSPYTAPQPP